MKKNLKLFTGILFVLISFNACNTEEQVQEESSDYIYSKSFNNGMLKSYNNNMILKWDEAISLAIDNKFPPPPESRTYAMVSLAIHDALNNIVPKYETYALDNTQVNSHEVSKKNIYQLADAAVAQAAHDVLVVLAPFWKINADNLLGENLSAIAESEFKTKGIQIGQDAASAILNKRQYDLTPLFVGYTGGTNPGEYRADYLPWALANPNPPFWPANAIYAPDWGQLMPFGIESGDQFRPMPPYAVNSPEYTLDYNEVKRLGCNECPDRTQEQSDMGTFFIENTPSSMNRIFRVLAIQENLNGWETARLLALTHMTQADAHISVFEAKYFYNTWRPITAIRQGDNDGNDDTVGDLNWTILQRPGMKPTPPIPTYPSTHAETGSAGAEIFKLYFGMDYKSFTIGSYNLPNVERSYTSFSQLADEISLSRIYIGYHFRNDVVEGEKMGKALAKYIYSNNLREIK